MTERLEKSLVFPIVEFILGGFLSNGLINWTQQVLMISESPQHVYFRATAIHETVNLDRSISTQPLKLHAIIHDLFIRTIV